MIQVAMLWLVNSRGELLLARRADHKAQDPGLWGPSVTGKLEPGETPGQAIVREAHEELALSPNDYTLRYVLATDFDHPDGELRKFTVYAAAITTDIMKKLAFDANEVAEIAWKSLSETKQLLDSKPGDTVVASAFILWEQIFDELQKQGVLHG